MQNDAHHGFTEGLSVLIMSRAMATSYQIDYISLARNGDSLTCSLTVNRLPRLQKLVNNPGSIAVSLRFFEDGELCPRVAGRVQFIADLPCHRCPESVSREISASISVCLVASEGEAERLAGKHDVLIVPAEGLSVCELIEDDLLLSLPSRICEKVNCEFDPLPKVQTASVGKGVGKEESQERRQEDSGETDPFDELIEQDRQRPFKSLRELMIEESDSSGKSSNEAPENK